MLVDEVFAGAVPMGGVVAFDVAATRTAAMRNQGWVVMVASWAPA